MRKLTTYNFDVKLEYLDEYKSNHESTYYNVQFQVLAENLFNAQSILEKWLEKPEQTGWKYKSWLGIRPMPSGLIIVDENEGSLKGICKWNVSTREN